MSQTAAITGYSAAQAALKHPHLEQALYDAGALVMEDALITLHGEAHSRRRVTELHLSAKPMVRRQKMMNLKMLFFNFKSNQLLSIVLYMRVLPAPKSLRWTQIPVSSFGSMIIKLRHDRKKVTR